MIVQTTRRFDKAFAKLSENDQKRVEVALGRFVTDPFHPALRDHSLVGKLSGLRAISAGYDLRIIYQEDRGHVTVVLINVGTHDEVY